MRRKLLAVAVMTVIFAGMMSVPASAGTWSEYWGAFTGYVSEKWDSVVAYVGGLFAKNEDSLPQESSENLPEAVAENWVKLTGTLSDTLTLRDKQETLPKSSWLPFREDQKSNGEKINALLDRALSILVKGDAEKVRRNAAALRDRITKQRAEVDDLRNKRITAPEKSRNPLRQTKAKIDDRVAELQEEIADNEQSLNAINAKLADALKEIGLELDASQTDILLNSITGDDLMNNAAVFANVKIVVEKLEELAQNESNTLEITKRYTGMYLVLNDLLLHTQEELVRKIDEEYKPQLKGIISEAESLRRNALTRSNQDVYSRDQRRGFAANAQSNALTIQVANLYVELLETQRRATMESIKSLRLNRDLAENTYKTVRSSAELRGLIRTGLKVFDTLETLKMPELKIFENGVMRLEFEEINRRLKK
ncbi:MAG: hypothetical protein IJU26_03640 [Synergistaceae bacterium]|nr:hypothetical protein [Synergistaceae bacterium]